METITIGKRTLKLQKPTLGFVLKVESKRFRELLSGEDQNIDPDDDVAVENAVKKASENWEGFCKTIFRHSWIWKITGFPRWLKYTNLRISEIQEVLNSFFTFYMEVKKPSAGNQTSPATEPLSTPPISQKDMTPST